jgi:hypothetical protein
MVYIPPGVPSALINLSVNASVLALEVRTATDLTADTEPTSALDSLVDARIATLRADHLARLMTRRTPPVRRSR